MSEDENEYENCCETNRLIVCCSSSHDENNRIPLHLDSCEQPAPDKVTRIRNLSGFWILGLCNNYGYVIMLSAAFDILHPRFHNETEPTSSVNETFKCNPISTGAILLADILPALAIKVVAPLFISGTHFRVLLAVLLSATSFLLTSLSVGQWMSFLGVIAAALSSGLGEVTFLAYSSHFEKDVVSTWSSGTGGAGVVGALSYAALTSVMTPRTTLQVMLVMPALLAVTFWLILVHPLKMRLCAKRYSIDDSGDYSESTMVINDPVKQFTFKEKANITKSLLKYMIPLSLVYFAEYFINQGLFGNAVFLFFVAYYGFLPSIWIVFVLILFEGLMGGAAYVNTFYKISQEVPENQKEFSMSVASLGDSCGIALAGGVALPVHGALCRALTM